MADIEFTKLPPVADLEIATRQRVVALLESLDQVAAEKAKLLDREDDLKNDLTSLQKSSGKAGFKHGWLCFASQPVAGKRTLDKGMLLEAGVAATVIAQCYKTGAPSTRCTFKRLSEEK